MVGGILGEWFVRKALQGWILLAQSLDTYEPDEHRRNQILDSNVRVLEIIGANRVKNHTTDATAVTLPALVSRYGHNPFSHDKFADELREMWYRLQDDGGSDAARILVGERPANPVSDIDPSAAYRRKWAALTDVQRQNRILLFARDVSLAYPSVSVEEACEFFESRLEPLKAHKSLVHFNGKRGVILNFGDAVSYDADLRSLKYCTVSVEERETTGLPARSSRGSRKPIDADIAGLAVAIIGRTLCTSPALVAEEVRLSVSPDVLILGGRLFDERVKRI
ncbi:hypothetical protein HDU93_000548, partial [Gonapodya sp. JEL0774]